MVGYKLIFSCCSCFSNPVLLPFFLPLCSCVLVSTKHLSSSTPKNIQALWYLDKAVALKLKCHRMSLFWRVSVSGQVSLGRQIVPLIRASSTPQSISQTQQDLFWQNSTQRFYEVSFAFIVLIWLTAAQSFGDDLLMPRLMRKYARHPVVVGDVIQQI